MAEQKKNDDAPKEKISRPEASPILDNDLIISAAFASIGNSATYLKVSKPNIKLDELASQALKKIAESGRFKKALDEVMVIIKREALTANISEVTKRINKTSLTPINRLLLSKETIYGFLLLYALREEKIKGSDVEGIYHSVLRNLNEFILDLIPVNHDEAKYK